MNSLLQVTTTTVHPPKSGGTKRSHEIVKSFPKDKWSVRRFCQGGIFTNHNIPFSLDRVIEVDEGYIEYRPLNPFHDIISIPEGLFDIPPVIISKWLEAWPPGILSDLIADSDVILVEGPLQFPAIYRMSDGTPIVYSSHNVEVERLNYLQKTTLGKILYERIKNIEKYAIEKSNAVICTSTRDMETFKQIFDTTTRFHIAPNGTNQHIPICVDEPDNGELTGIFVGSDYQPNREAVSHIIDIATNNVAGVDVKYNIVGNVCDSIRDSPPNVELLGYVEDLEKVFSQADFALNPISSGAGTNIKALDYMGAGLPLITTPFGARGLNIQDKKEALIMEIEEFTDGILMLRDPNFRKEIAISGQEYVHSNHNWENISKSLFCFLESLVRDR